MLVGRDRAATAATDRLVAELRAVADGPGADVPADEAS